MNKTMNKEELTELLDKYHDSCVFSLKLNFGLLAGIISFLSLLKFAEPEIYQLIGEIRPGIVFIGIMIVYGLIFKWFILNCKINLFSKGGLLCKRIKQLKSMSVFYLAMQILIVICIVYKAYNFGSEYRKGFKVGYAVSMLHQSIEYFYNKNGKFPSSIEELNKKNNVVNYIETIGKKHLRYELVDGKYKLIFFGEDNKFGTMDDKEYSHNSFLEHKKRRKRKKLGL